MPDRVKMSELGPPDTSTKIAEGLTIGYRYRDDIVYVMSESGGKSTFLAFGPKTWDSIAKAIESMKGSSSKEKSY